ncbi:multi-sensor signal transduction histidine kinase [Sulfurimonas denitrificans DSM 1251]|uniref:histidine kinase n=1 Tax=Sulfurimonas denitrificans (strain ATCC 33889 / DSM 1251) TaxID=326298 RepID=Q30RY7_SULDN|nr:PAS domain-containing protein [Sulfurimonas denitrificans]ABB44244.1 multi-sensor signal transduction histidine kinase [Sulfurimonas denitrificans DSM 1251]
MSSFKIFAIDDEIHILDFYKNILKQKESKAKNFFDSLESKEEIKDEFDLYTFETPKEYLMALQECYENEDKVAVSIIDMRLPQMHGLEVAKRAREIDENMNIIIVTAFADFSVDEILGRIEKNVYYLHKPFRHDELLVLVTTGVRNYQTNCSFSEVMNDIAIDATQDGFWDWNPITNEVYYSPKWKQMLGYSEEEITNTLEEWSSRVHPDDIQDVMQTLKIHLEKKNDYYISEHRIRAKNGNYVWILDRGKASFDADAKPIRVTGFHSDITKRKELEEQLLSGNKELESKLETIINSQMKLENTNAQLEERLMQEIQKSKEQENMLLKHVRQAAMGEMISMIAHQWRQPISTISIVADNILMGMMLGDETKEDTEEGLSVIKKQVVHLSQTIDDFRSFFAPNKSKEHTFIKDAIDSALSIIEANLKNSNIKIIKMLEDTKAINIYKNEMIQVFLNILKNANDALLYAEIENPTITIRSYEDESGITVSIMDNGDGIKEEIIDKIFESYFTTKNEKNGTGLGLYMVKTIVEQRCQGTIIAKNSDDGGAEFVIRFTFF